MPRVPYIDPMGLSELFHLSWSTLPEGPRKPIFSINSECEKKPQYGRYTILLLMFCQFQQVYLVTNSAMVPKFCWFFSLLGEVFVVQKLQGFLYWITVASVELFGMLRCCYRRMPFRNIHIHVFKSNQIGHDTSVSLVQKHVLVDFFTKSWNVMFGLFFCSKTEVKGSVIW